MADYRSRKIEVVNGKAYSAGQSQAYPSSFAHNQSYSEPPPNYNNNNNNKTPKSKPSKLWNFNDPEVKRRKRVASYKVYTVEGRVKATFRKSFRWIKDKYTEILQGWYGHMVFFAGAWNRVGSWMKPEDDGALRILVRKIVGEN